ncbi:hypothetical protein J2W40_003627 [Sphingobium xenophagum]|uniref:YubB ferredoxin-like domain-containing protein n=1 Tax=Sphingobium xenophagum TaxID=121428 RepID=A0ABU1X6V5_SPHXE|nr:hypothetical protein [Sphingobium xenophagum]MDR7156782.1 hypothetical protein [Sphingobium xenophagum]
MADHCVQGSFAFTCTARESALIEEAWQHASDLLADLAPGEPSAEFLAAFMPNDLANPFNGLLEIFDDPDFPDFGAEIEIAGAAERTVAIYGTTDFQPGPIAELIRRCCQESLKVAPIGFVWSYGCSRPRRDSFGGGWCAIFADHVEFASTQEELARRLVRYAVTPPVEPPDPWIDYPEYPSADWQAEVANGDTRLGYLDWALALTEADYRECCSMKVPSA